MTYIKDVGWLLLIVVLAPLWMAFGWVLMLGLLVRHLHMWARGNTTAFSR